MDKRGLILSMILVMVNAGSIRSSEENFVDTVKLLREQVNALLDYRQQDYNALEESLKRAIEKNTEIIVLKNEVKQLRKEMNVLRGGSGNEAKNERLRVRWLGSAVSELQSEVAEVLRARNASEELAERSRMRSELTLLRGDVAEVGRGVRDLGGRITQTEAALGIVRGDIAAIKERASLMSRTCADITSQLSTVQIELKSCKCDSHVEHKRLSRDEDLNEIKSNEHPHRSRHGYSRTLIHHVEDRLTSIERKIAMVSRKRATIEKRVVYENQEYLISRIKSIENSHNQLARRLSNLTDEMSSTKKLSESVVRLLDSVQTLEEKLNANRSDTKKELLRLGVNAAKKAAELSVTRVELENLRRTVQALSVSASKLQEKSDLQQDSIERLNGTLNHLDLSKSLDEAKNVTHALGEVEDRYRLIVDALPSDCQEKNGLELIAPGHGAPLLASCHEGWIVVARRIDGSADFDKTWNEYSSGFGSPVSEFWIGNEALHALTRDNCSRLRIDLTDINGAKWRAEYDYFNVDSEETGYRLRVDGYNGNATDALSYQNGMSFSAKDRDMDISSTDCAANYHGGWWFSHCQHANLNGRYSLGLTWYRSESKEWMLVARSEMSIRKKETCR